MFLEFADLFAGPCNSTLKNDLSLTVIDNIVNLHITLILIIFPKLIFLKQIEILPKKLVKTNNI